MTCLAVDVRRQGSGAARALAEHLHERVDEYFPEEPASPEEIQLIGEQVRPASSLLRFAVRYGDHERVLLIKMSTAARSDRPAQSKRETDRPRVAPLLDGNAAFVLEYRALQCIHQHFINLGDPRFGAVRVFEMLPEQNAVVMEALTQPNLRELVLRHGRRPSGDLSQVFRNCGAWLHAYHDLPGMDPAESWQVGREGFAESVEALSSYLAGHLGSTTFFARLAERTKSLAHAWLPEELPLGLAHGDYAMRNILVGPGHRVTVLDTPARYRTAIYRDVACFLANLRWSRLSGLAGGAVFHLARSNEYRKAFLAGYFGDAARCSGAIHLYEIQAILERWATVVTLHAPGAPTSARPGFAMTRLALSAYFRGLIRGKLRETK
jgi:hypothetical protein